MPKTEILVTAPFGYAPLIRDLSEGQAVQVQIANRVCFASTGVVTVYNGLPTAAEGGDSSAALTGVPIVSSWYDPFGKPRAITGVSGVVTITGTTWVVIWGAVNASGAEYLPPVDPPPQYNYGSGSWEIASPSEDDSGNWIMQATTLDGPSLFMETVGTGGTVYSAAELTSATGLTVTNDNGDTVSVSPLLFEFVATGADVYPFKVTRDGVLRVNFGVGGSTFMQFPADEDSGSDLMLSTTYGLTINTPATYTSSTLTDGTLTLSNSDLFTSVSLSSSGLSFIVSGLDDTLYSGAGLVQRQATAYMTFAGARYNTAEAKVDLLFVKDGDRFHVTLGPALVAGWPTT